MQAIDIKFYQKWALIFLKIPELTFRWNCYVLFAVAALAMEHDQFGRIRTIRLGFDQGLLLDQKKFMVGEGMLGKVVGVLKNKIKIKI